MGFNGNSAEQPTGSDLDVTVPGKPIHSGGG
jgi:hypothetical protein